MCDTFCIMTCQVENFIFHFLIGICRYSLKRICCLPRKKDSFSVQLPNRFSHLRGSNKMSALSWIDTKLNKTISCILLWCVRPAQWFSHQYQITSAYDITKDCVCDIKEWLDVWPSSYFLTCDIILAMSIEQNNVLSNTMEPVLVKLPT